VIKFLKPKKIVKRSPKRKKVVRALALGLFLVLPLAYFLIIRPALGVLAQTRALYSHALPFKDALYLQDLVKVEEELAKIDQDRVLLEEALRPLSWVKAIPFFGGYYRDGEHLLRAGGFGISAGQKMVTVIEPVADLMGFRTKTSEGRAVNIEDRLEGAVQVMPEVAVGLDAVGPDLLRVREEIAHIKPGRYPRFISFGGASVGELLTQLLEATATFDEALPKAKEALLTLPGILGDPKPQTYVLIFQNDKEIRPTGGFWTAYALITLSGGKITDIKSDDMYQLDYRIAVKTPAPDLYQRFLKIEHFYIRDTNLSPDFAVSARLFHEFWRRVEGVPPVDGVLALDTFFVKGLLEVLGPVDVAGYQEPFNADNVVVELERYATLLLKEQAGRKNLIGYLMDAILDKAFDAPKNLWLPLVQESLTLVSEKHFLAYLFDSRAQALVEEHNLAGRVVAFAGDYLQVNEANFAGAKANLYVTRTVRQVISRGDEGWTKEVTIDFVNPEPYDGWLNGPYRAYVRLLVPEGSELISIEGSKEAVPQQSYFDAELGKQVFAAFNVTKPQDASQLVFKYRLPDSVVQGGKYQLLIQKQPGLDTPGYEVQVGKRVEKFNLNKDWEAEFENF